MIALVIYWIHVQANYGPAKNAGFAAVMVSFKPSQPAQVIQMIFRSTSRVGCAASELQSNRGIDDSAAEILPPPGHRGEECYAELNHIMETAMPLNVPVKAEGGVGKNWADEF